jgi:hypothetical protein
VIGYVYRTAWRSWVVSVKDALPRTVKSRRTGLVLAQSLRCTRAVTNNGRGDVEMHCFECGLLTMHFSTTTAITEAERHRCVEQEVPPTNEERPT